MTDAQTIAAYDARAEDYRAMMEKLGPDPALTEFLARLPEYGRVLDLGCGTGEITVAMMDAGFEVTGWDASAEMVRIARAAGADAHVARFDDLDEVAAFDGVCASFSLLHAPRADFPRHLARIHAALRPGGYLFLGMKLGAGAARDDLGRHYTYYSETELEENLGKAGFRIVYRRLDADAGLSGETYPFAVMIAHA